MSSATGIQELLNEKAQLQRMLERMEEEGKYLENRLRTVEEALAVQELKRNIKAKRAVLDQLKFKIRELESRLEKPHTEQMPPEVMVEVVPSSSQ